MTSPPTGSSGTLGPLLGAGRESGPVVRQAMHSRHCWARVGRHSSSGPRCERHSAVAVAGQQYTLGQFVTIVRLPHFLQDSEMAETFQSERLKSDQRTADIRAP